MRKFMDLILLLMKNLLQWSKIKGIGFEKEYIYEI
ncbi:hypothetical protein DESME_01680 [Desulfitobacterium metallireducens DSM 15288]|uniref:Uncharacterized protein n=1 Tax=Desulfitobacterium metallireducens DSM 15288 TaxID=871968 RepID=W0EGR0_9FIRM|nr:hypothetical protein DESME_01680 [Desulfitobacterium metallireducens DSM 15288]